MLRSWAVADPRLSQESDYSIRWGVFMLVVVAAAFLATTIVLLAVRTVKRRSKPRSRVRRAVEVTWTVLVGLAAVLSTAVTFIGLLSWGGGGLVGYLFVANPVLIGWFIWRIVQCRLARNGLRRP
jgi:amino acid transporter